MMTTMKAAVIHEAGGPEVLKIESLPTPKAQSGEVLVRVKAFGLNRSELFTRQGQSPSVKFPRVLGIEAVGVVESAPGSEFRKGDIVATAMGGMGRQFDGGYAEFTCVPATQVQVVKTERSEEHTSELQSPDHLVCRLLLEKKKKTVSSKRPGVRSSRDTAPIARCG